MRIRLRQWRRVSHAPCACAACAASGAAARPPQPPRAQARKPSQGAQVGRFAPSPRPHRRHPRPCTRRLGGRAAARRRRAGRGWARKSVASLPPPAPPRAPCAACAALRGLRRGAPPPHRFRVTRTAQAPFYICEFTFVNYRRVTSEVVPSFLRVSRDTENMFYNISGLCCTAYGFACSTGRMSVPLHCNQ